MTSDVTARNTRRLATEYKAKLSGWAVVNPAADSGAEVATIKPLPRGSGALLTFRGVDYPCVSLPAAEDLANALGVKRTHVDRFPTPPLVLAESPPASS